MKKSTKEFFKLYGWRHPFLFLHGYYYITKLDRYVSLVAKLMRLLTRNFPKHSFTLNWFAGRYHAKVVRTEDARKFVTLQRDIKVDPSIAEQVIPFKIANQIILKNPEHITVMDCACRLEKKEHCTPIQVCLVIGEPGASFVADNGARVHARRIESEEALRIVKDSHDRDWVHTIWLKDAMGNRTYAMCNCCRCCCVGMEGMRLLQTLKIENPPRAILPSGYVAVIDEEKCTGCGVCEETCPFDASEIDTVAEKARVLGDKCMGCGVCIDNCRQGASNLMKDPKKGIPLDLDELQPR
ncbi:MAG: 4Fe-4S binding protein [Deltaproteobacteria bacterium]|nr:MAG: 4Fe-4S binding protein [Deltaproteobacteria bacterium]